MKTRLLNYLIIRPCKNYVVVGLHKADRKPNLRKTYCMVAAVFLGLVLMAKAGTETFSVNSTVTTFGVNTPLTLALPQFNSSFGTLDSVTITLQLINPTNTVATLVNNGPNTVYNAEAHAELTIALGSDAFSQAVDVYNPNEAGNPWVDVSTTHIDSSLASGGTYGPITTNLSTKAGASATAFAITDSTLFTDMTGTGTIDLNALGTVNDLTGGSTDGTLYLSGSISTSGGVEATVTYDYSVPEVVPEPTTYAMVFCGFGMLLFLQKLRHGK
jgi:hypothetical protein